MLMRISAELSALCLSDVASLDPPHAAQLWHRMPGQERSRVPGEDSLDTHRLPRVHQGSDAMCPDSLQQASYGTGSRRILADTWPAHPVQLIARYLVPFPLKAVGVLP